MGAADARLGPPPATVGPADSVQLRAALANVDSMDRRVGRALDLFFANAGVGKGAVRTGTGGLVCPVAGMEEQPI